MTGNPTETAALIEEMKKDIEILASHCVFMRSIYLHGKILFEHRTQMAHVAPIFFGDISKIIVEYTILQVCKITDPAQDFRENDNHTIAFLLKHYDFTADPAAKERLAQLDAQLQAFRTQLLPARNKLISHFDRDAILVGKTLGGVPQIVWDEFWIDLQEVVCIFYEKAFGTRLYINGVARSSDAYELLKAAETWRKH